MKEQEIANFLLSKGMDKKEIIHFINRCRVIPMVGSIYHIKGLSNNFYSFLNEVMRKKNVKNNYQINGICLRECIIKTFDL